MPHELPPSSNNLDAIEDRIRTLQMSGALDRSDVWNGGTSLSETSNGFMLFKLKLERRKLRNAIRGEFNGNFGSAFSTIYSPTLFGNFLLIDSDG